MLAVGIPLAFAPVIAFLAISYAVYPRDPDTVAPLRLAVVRGTLATGTYAIGVVELLGAIDQLDRLSITLAWLPLVLTALAMAAWRRRQGPWRWARPAPPTARAERLLAGTAGALLLVEFVIALLAEPNNYDSQTYHLPKVEHWVAQGSLDFWPTAIHRQVTLPPGAEYLLLHLRLFTGGDQLYNLLQWCAAVGCVLAASRIVAQFGGARRAQLLTVFVLATTPMVALQATSTQTDLVVAAWVGCLGTLVLDESRRITPVGAVVALGAATGLIALTKTSGLLAAGPLLLLWGLAQIRLAWAAKRRALAESRAVAAGLLALGIGAVVVGPFLARVTAEFGHPLGPPRLRESIPMQRHDPAAILINGLRVAHTALDTPVGPMRDTSAWAIERLSVALGVDPQNRAITFGQSTFPVSAWYPDEDRVSFPLAGTLALIGVTLALAKPRRIAPRHPLILRGYALALVLAVLLHVATIKWQPWGNRLLLYALMLATPMVGLWLDELLRRRRFPGRRSTAVAATGVVLGTCALAAVLTMGYGFPRRLVGAGSLLTTSEWETRFLRRPQWAQEYQWAAAQIRSAGAQRVGLVQGNDDWEYPWWLLLRDEGAAADHRAEDGRGRQIVALQSVLPNQSPPNARTVDAIVCTGDRAACSGLVPEGWRIEFRGYVGYALPPR